jgi:hypothetical protein
MIEGIEQDTLEDPPLLFREYVGAPVEIKRIMDSQFKLVKTWARLKAKGGWYSWRDQLLGGVMPTLHKNADGLRKVRVLSITNILMKRINFVWQNYARHWNHYFQLLKNNMKKLNNNSTN